MDKAGQDKLANESNGVNKSATSGFRALVEQARAGTDDAVDELVNSCRDYLLLVANREMGQHLQAKMGASDAVQSALVQAQKHLREFRGESREELLGWLRKILQNEIYANHRKFTAEKRDLQREVVDAAGAVDLADTGRSPSGEAIHTEEVASLRNALSRLPDDYRTVVVLRTWDKLPFDEVGRKMNRSTGAVKKLWSRAMKRLQQELKDEVDGSNSQ